MLLGSIVSMVIALTLLPAVLSNGDQQAPQICGLPAGQMEVILTTIRSLESGGDYTAEAAGSSASGAYQFVDGTWDGYGGHARAVHAPPEVQDAKAAETVGSILDDHDGDVSAIPVVWYIGHLPAPGSTTWDTVPFPSAGNVLTPRQYQERWLRRYEELLTPAPVDDGRLEVTSPLPGGCVGGSVAPVVEGWSLPGPRTLIEANPEVLTYPHHSYPAWDWMIPINTPIYAVRGGRVATVHQWPRNWWSEGCGVNSTGCVPCGVGLTIVDVDGTRWSYCHGTNLTVRLGDNVTAGQQVMWSGNTGRSGAPHLHLEIRSADGQRRCPQELLIRLLDRTPLQAAAPLPATGCSF